MSGTTPGHQPRYFTPPNRAADAEAFACGVTCSCGRFNRVAHSKKSQATAEANARRQHDRHVAECVEIDASFEAERAERLRETKAWVAIRPRDPTPAKSSAPEVSEKGLLEDWEPTKGQLRAILVGVAVLVLGLVVWGGGSLFGVWPSAEESAAGSACDSWSWDADLTASENEQRLGDIFRDHDAHFADAYEEMRDQCRSVLQEYTAAVNEQRKERSSHQDTSVEDALEEAQLSATDVNGLIRAANRHGYGPADEGLAAVLIDTCEEIRAGNTTYQERIRQDTGDGADPADAEAFYGYVEDQFCPAVRVVPPSDIESGGGVAANGTVGLLAPPSAVPKSWKSTEAQPCVRAGGSATGTHAAFTVGSGVIACLDVASETLHFDGVALEVAVVLDPARSVSEVERLLLSFLPKDARLVGQKPGRNAPFSTFQGSCSGLLFSSTILGDQDRRLNPGGAGEDVALAYLYPDRQTGEGSTAKFEGKVGFVSLIPGGYAYQRGPVLTC
jgi:hypothetical protein